MQYIDFRFRPPYSKYLSSWMYDVPEDGTNRTMFNTPYPESVCQKSLELCIKEMDEAGIQYAVCPVRKAFDMDNEELLPLLEQYPERFIGIACIEPMGGIDKALAEIERFVINGPMNGIILEPGLDKHPWYFDDVMMNPIYEKCQKENILVLVTYGGILAPDNTYYFPWRVDNVAKRFPNLKMLICHGGWPWATQMCQIAYERANVYISPEVYMAGDAPGKNDYILAGNCLLRKKMVFASTYPAADPKIIIESFRNDGLREEVLEDIFYNNAASLLGLK